jgi:hypothetical protein
MSSFKEHLKEYAEKELELTGFNETSFSKTAIELLENLADLTNGDAETMKQLCYWLPRLIDRIPISPITETDFELENPNHEHSELNLMRCTRYPQVYQTTDGKYWDDRAVAFRFVDSPETDRMFVYRPNGSKREITLPYYPNTKIEYLDKDSV